MSAIISYSHTVPPIFNLPAANTYIEAQDNKAWYKSKAVGPSLFSLMSKPRSSVQIINLKYLFVFDL